MSLKSLINSKTIFSIIILACFVLNTIPNQAIYDNDIIANESVILDNKAEDSISRSEGYDLGIDSIEHDYHSDYWMGACSSECDVVESMVSVDIRITVTNYGSEPVDEVIISLKIKTTEDGLVQYDNTFFTDAFPASHPMHLSDPLQTGDSVVFTFNRTNDYLNLLYQDENPNYAKSVIFLLSGLSYIQAKIIGEDDDADNNRFRKDVEVAKWIENGEYPYDEIGPSITFGDTDDNGANSLDNINMHRATEFDHDADGCGWDRECTEEEGTDNISAALSGNSAIATFNSEGWYKTNANSANCDWDTFGDTNCPKFTSEPYQDDYIVSPGFDLRAMRELTLSFAYRGSLEEGDLLRVQVKNDNMVDWYNLWNLTSDDSSWDWQTFDLNEEKSEKLTDFYGSDVTDTIYFRFQAFSDGDDTTECNNSPCSIFFIDNIIIRGGENVTRDVAVGDISVREGANMIVKHAENSLHREINATLMNVGESGWNDLLVRFSVTNLQGQDVSYALDCGEQCVLGLGAIDGNTIYGDVTQGGGHEHETELFVLFKTPEANTYFVTVTAIVPPAKDFFPWNNSLTFTFRVFDTFFKDDVDTPEDRSSIYSWNKPNRLQGTQNVWKERNIGNDAYSSQYVWQYAKEASYDKDNPNTAAGSDDSLITQDMYDRDGASPAFDYDLNVDLRAAFKPILSFAIKWDFAAGDRLEVRAATDFDSTQAITSGTWTVLKTYEEDCSCSWTGSDQWVVEELDLEAFEGYQTWIDFRVVTANGGGKGVMLDDILVIGNEYHNNVMIESIDLGSQYPESDNELSVTIKGIGLLPQEGLTVYAQIIDSNGMRVWPTDRTFNFFEVPSNYDPDGNGVFGLEKSQTFTVDPSTAGDDWHYGASLEEGTYYVHVEVWRDDESQVHDEAPENNFWDEMFALINHDDDNDGVFNHLDECPGTYIGSEVDEYGCSDSQKDSDNDGFTDDVDDCPNNYGNSSEDMYGCPDSDEDGWSDFVDEFPDDSYEWLDSDEDSVGDNSDECKDTPTGSEVDGIGCSDSQKDGDNDGVTDDMDECSASFIGDGVREDGCTIVSHMMISAGDDLTVNVGEVVQFNGAGDDGYHEIILYEWDFNNDGLYEWSSKENGRTTNIYNSAGNYVATFLITDSEGYTLTDSITILVEEEEDAKEEEVGEPIESGGIPSISMISVIGLLILTTIIRRKY
jgi:hypothetical protein